MGAINLDNTGSGGAITLSSDGTDLLLDGSAVGGGGGGSPDLFDESYDGTSTTPSATGTNSVAIGKGSTASGQESMAVLDGNAVSQDSFSLGGNVYANAIGGTQIGKGGIVGGYGFPANYGVSIGYQAVAARTESIALGKAYSGGTNSFAAAMNTNSSSYGAQGYGSIVIGQNSKATATRSFAIGATCSSTSENSITIGHNNTTSGFAAFAFGSRASSAVRGKYAFAAGRFSADGDAQGGQFILRADTTDATATVLTTNNNTAAADNQIVAASDTCITFDGTITAMQNGAQSYASWRVEGLLVNDAGTTTVANSAITVIDNQSSWGLTLTADNTNNALAITFTGEAAHNIRTVANIRTTEVTYA